MLFLLTVRLKEIIYSGENVGNDLSFEFSVRGLVTRLRSKIACGQRKSFNEVLLRSPFPEGSISLPVSVDITEEDPVFHDTGSGSSLFTVQLRESETQTHSFNADVVASGGDKGKRATLTFMLEAVIDALKVEITFPNAGQMFFIDSTPKMPTIDFVADTDPPGQAPAGASIDWNIEIIYADHSLAAQGAIDTETGTGNSAPGTTFTPTFGKLIGDTGETSPGGIISRCRASATLKIGSESYCSDTVDFHVRGRNPSGAELNAVLAPVTGIAPRYPHGTRSVTMSATIVQAVVRKESGKKQFEADGTPVLGVSQRSYWAKRGDRGIFQNRIRQSGD